ncbi:unnamed protein product [Effrenium voratum]|nr:unnamed protein product [Effrenium voratum]
MHWALGASHDFTYHPRRGQFHANLISGPTVELDMSGYQNISMTMPNVPVVLGPGGYDQKNPYVCNIFNLEEMLPAGLTADNKHHVAMFSPILDPDSVQYVHHMILYACNDQARVSFSHNQVVPECESMPQGCSELKWPWAMGSEPVVFPPQVGMPIGQGQKWFALQMHYYNPSLHTGVTDSSGVRISLADSVRAYDAGAFRFNGGTGPSMRAALPPGVPLLTVKQALLPAACTNEWQEDVNVLGVVYHAHLVGKRLNIEVLRGSESLGELRKEKLYDFNHQSLEPASVKTLKKGDQLVMTCTYDTSSRTTPTQFGDSTQTEMCWSAFMYYPVQKMNRVLFTSEDWMLCEGAAQQYHANTIPSIPASTCQAVGDVGSQTALDLLASMGVNVTGVTERPSTSSTSPEGLSVSASTTASGWLLAVWAFGAF